MKQSKKRLKDVQEKQEREAEKESRQLVQLQTELTALQQVLFLSSSSPLLLPFPFIPTSPRSRRSFPRSSTSSSASSRPRSAPTPASKPVRYPLFFLSSPSPLLLILTSRFH